VSREAILGRIRAARDALRADGAADRLPNLPDPQRFDDPIGLFADRAEQVGTHVDTVASVGAAVEGILAFCVGRGFRRAAVWTTPVLTPVADGLRTAGVDVLGPGAVPGDLAAADVGITGAEWGVAETATLVLPSGVDQPRLVSLLPAVHVAVLAADRVLPDLHALFEKIGTLPSGLTLVTGPSRSADIGLTPVLGAHGPIEVRVFLVRVR
jgi:L-lactate dehydrogenase complex protein LldG